jgi:hypothetical protein
MNRLIGAPESWGIIAAYARKKIEREFDARKQAVTLAEIYNQANRTSATKSAVKQEAEERDCADFI